MATAGAMVREYISLEYDVPEGSFGVETIPEPQRCAQGSEGTAAAGAWGRKR